MLWCADHDGMPNEWRQSVAEGKRGGSKRQQRAEVGVGGGEGGIQMG